MAAKTVARVNAVHRFEGKEYKVHRGDDLSHLPKTLVTKLKAAGLTLEVEDNADSNTKTSEK